MTSNPPKIILAIWLVAGIGTVIGILSVERHPPTSWLPLLALFGLAAVFLTAHLQLLGRAIRSRKDGAGLGPLAWAANLALAIAVGLALLLR